jgi:pyridinium-3,5-bisthiocarboxylic acid mononucleotide nickel chelatase
MNKYMQKNNEHSLIINFNVDDINPQHVPYFIEKVIDAGAADAFVTPIIMKKGRPGYLFTITCSIASEEKILDMIFSQSTTIGVRRIETNGIMLKCTTYKRNSSLGEIFVKEIEMPSGKTRIIPEYDDCRKIAETRKMPLKEVQEVLLFQLNQSENNNEMIEIINRGQNERND